MIKYVGVVAIVAAVIVSVLCTNMPDETMASRPQKCSYGVNHIGTGGAGRVYWNEDARSYLWMSAGLETLPPYKYRYLMPWLSRQALRVVDQPMESMVLVSMVALWMFYVVSAVTCYYLGIGLLATLAGLLGVQMFWHTYIYISPWVPDSVQFLCAAVMILALVKRKYWIYLVALAVGMMNKEAIMFLAPAWFITREYKKATLATLAAVALFIAPRYSEWGLYSEVAGLYSDKAIGHIVHHPLQALATVILGWGIIWIISAMGAVKNKEILFIWLLMFTGSIIACLGAADFGRMVASMVPVMFISVALFFHTEVIHEA